MLPSRNGKKENGNSPFPSAGDMESPSPALSPPRLIPQSMSQLDRATMAATSEMVELLFGVSGSCWGSFPCSHQRIPGRLYAVSTAILFYSNMMGFERRICLQFTEIESMALHRSTSIRIELCSEEVFIFKSFQERRQVLQTLMAIKRLELKERRRHPSGLRLSDDVVSGGMLTDEEQSFDSLCDNSTLDSLRPSSLKNQSPSRRRLGSDSHVGLLSFDGSAVASNERNDGLCDVNSPEVAAQPVEQAKWEDLNQNVKKLENIGVDNERLPCSLQHFFETFLANNAPHSLDRFQRDDIQDKDVVVTPWKGDNGVFTREITFRHQIKSSFGPSEAPTTRSQRMRRFESKGITLENTTKVENTPASDAFVAEDYWVITADGEDHVILSVYFAPRFLKRTMFKGIIEKSVKQATAGWFQAYVEKVKKILAPLPPGVVTPRELSAPHSLEDLSILIATNLQRLIPWFIATTILLVLIFAVLVLQLVIAWKDLLTRQEEVSCLIDDSWSQR